MPEGPSPRSRHKFAEPPPLPVRPEDPDRLQGRLVVGLIISAIVGLAALVTALGIAFAGEGTPGNEREVMIGPFQFFLSTALPPREMVAAALLGMVVIAAVAVSLELIAALLTVNPARQVLSAHRPRLPAGSQGPLRITVLVPAHNEEVSLPVTLAALGRQTRPPDRVVVVADNCTDSTVDIARRMGHEAFQTVRNQHRKGGALNQALGHLLPTMDADDLVMVMDADTSLSPRFLEVALERLMLDPELTAVGGMFYGEDGAGVLGQFQRNEYARYQLHINARHGRVFVLTGTASIFRADALLDVAAARGVYLPGLPGNIYDTSALTEDNELTLALKALGATMTSPSECRVTTEIMPTWRTLYVQRKRWQRGAIENLAAHGITSATARNWGQQLGLGYGALAFALYVLMMAIALFSGATVTWFLFWIAIGMVFWLERVITAWSAGWPGRLLAALLIPELAYAFFLNVVVTKCLYDILVGSRTSWGHVQHAPAPKSES